MSRSARYRLWVENPEGNTPFEEAPSQTGSKANTVTAPSNEKCREFRWNPSIPGLNRKRRLMQVAMSEVTVEAVEMVVKLIAAVESTVEVAVGQSCTFVS